jgi:flavin reductase (DIM6/NTAB) family NADH-FMN oxidoreductase RutF
MQATFDSAQFRKVVSRFVTGITVVTTRLGDEVHGMTANAFCSVTLTPPSILVCLARSSRTAALVEQSRIFAVNILSERQTLHSDRFAGRHKEKEENRFEEIEWTTAVTGAPILAGSLAFLDCKLTNVFDGHSHLLCLGEVVAADTDEALPPLIYHQSRYLTLDHTKTV